MRSLFRSAGVTVVSLLAAFLMMVTTALPAWAGTTLVVGGIGQPTLLKSTMNLLLNRKWEDDTLEDVYWPAQAKPFTPGTYTMGQSIAIGVTNLYNAIMTSEVPITVVGLSGGSLVVDETMRKLLTLGDDEAPAKKDLTFYIIADSSRQQFINKTQYSSRLDYTYQPAPQTKYDVVVVTGEYDGFADFPDRWWNFTAVLNAYAGIITEHIPTALADLDAVPDDYITYTENALGGKTTHYLVPAKTLPLVKLFPSLKAREAALKVQIDAAYKRNDLVNTVNTVNAATFAAPQEVEVAGSEEEEEATPVVRESSVPATKRSTATVEEEAVSDEEPASGSDDDVIADEEESVDPDADAVPAADAEAAADADDDQPAAGKGDAKAETTSGSAGEAADPDSSDNAPSSDSDGSES